MNPTSPSSPAPKVQRSRSKGREEWDHIEDVKERKKIQNRLAQRTYRERMKKRIEALEMQNASRVSPESSGRRRSSARNHVGITVENCFLTPYETYHQAAAGYPTSIASSDDEQTYIPSPARIEHAPMVATPTLEGGYPAFENLAYKYHLNGGGPAQSTVWNLKVEPGAPAGVESIPSGHEFSHQFTCADRTRYGSTETYSSVATPQTSSTPEEVAEDSKTALHIAAEKGLQASVQVLLDMGCDVRARDSAGRTALHTAVENRHRDVAQELLKHAAEIDAQANNGQTALHAAALCGDEQMTLMLLSAGANVEIKESYGRSALHMAALGGNGPVLKLLVQRGADVNAKTGG